jgi:hypothetical protein
MPDATHRLDHELRGTVARDRALAARQARYIERLVAQDYDMLLRAMEVAALQSLATACAELGRALCVGRG